MVVVKDVNYLDYYSLPKMYPRPDCTLDLLQFTHISKSENGIYFFLNGKEEKKVQLLKNQGKVLEIGLFGNICQQAYQSIEIPLKATSDLKQVTLLLFSYFLQKKKDFLVNQVIELLVEKIMKTNLDILNDNSPIGEIIDYIHSNVDQQIKIQNLCQAAHISEVTLNRLCNKQVGMSPMQLLREIRCNEARKLLLESSLPIKEIGEKVGYKNNAHFSTVYRQVVGNTPIETRRELRAVSRR